MDEASETREPADFLKLGGLPLELKALEAFRSAGADSRHSDYVWDPDDNKQREVDVIAEFTPPRLAGSSDRVPVHLVYVVECKAGSKGEWLVYSSRRHGRRLRNFVEGRNFNSLVPTYEHHPMTPNVTTRIPLVNTSHLSWPEMPMYQVNSLGSHQQAAYSAVSKALSACAGLAYLSRIEGTSRDYLTVWIPVVVTSAAVYQVDTDVSPLHPTPAGAPVVVGMKIRDPELYHCVWVVEEGDLDAFAASAAEDANRLRLNYGL